MTEPTTLAQLRYQDSTDTIAGILRNIQPEQREWMRTLEQCLRAMAGVKLQSPADNRRLHRLIQDCRKALQAGLLYDDGETRHFVSLRLVQTKPHHPGVYQLVVTTGDKQIVYSRRAFPPNLSLVFRGADEGSL